MPEKKVVKRLQRKGFRIKQQLDNGVILEKRTKDGEVLEAEVQGDTVNGIPVQEYMRMI